MSIDLVVKTLGDARRAYIWWLFGTTAYVGLMAAVYPIVRDRSEEFQAMLEGYPEGLLAVFGLESGFSIASGVGFLTSYFFGWLVPGLFLIYAISFASRATAGEEEAGTMDLLLATPITRRTVIGHTFLALTLLLVGLASVLWVSIAVAGWIVTMDVPLGNLAAACVFGALLGLAAGAIALAIAAGTGRRSLAAGIGAGIGLFSYLFYTVGSLSDQFAALGKVSLMWLYFEPAPLVNGLRVGYALGLAAIAGGGWAAAAWLFDRHDIST